MASLIESLSLGYTKSFCGEMSQVENLTHNLLALLLIVPWVAIYTYSIMGSMEDPTDPIDQNIRAVKRWVYVPLIVVLQVVLSAAPGLYVNCEVPLSLCPHDFLQLASTVAWILLRLISCAGVLLEMFTGRWSMFTNVFILAGIAVTFRACQTALGDSGVV